MFKRLVVVLLMFGSLLLALDLTGKWKVVAQTPNGEEYNAELVMKQVDGKLSGAFLTAEGSEIPLQDVKLEKNELTFRLMLDSGSYALKLTVEEKAMKGTYTGQDGTTGPVTASR